MHGVPLTGDTTLVSAGGATSRFPAGRRVRVPRMLGHRDTNSTACPGTALYSQLEDLRARVATGEPLPGVATFLASSLSRAKVRYGGQAVFSGTLTGDAGEPLAGKPVKAEVLRAGRWQTLAELVTDAAGAWSIPVKPTATRLVRATYAGDAIWRRSYSAELLLRLAPVVTLGPTATEGVRGRRVMVSGQVTPRKRLVYQVLQQRIGGSYRRVGVRAGARARRALQELLRTELRRLLPRVRGGGRRRRRPLVAARRSAWCAWRAGSSHSPALTQRVRVEPAAGQEQPGGAEQDAHVEEQRAVVHVPDVQLDPLRPGERRATVHLCPAGDAGLDLEPPPLAVGVADPPAPGRSGAAPRSPSRRAGRSPGSEARRASSGGAAGRLRVMRGSPSST